MFRVQNNVPDVYVNDSRDFQLFARLYDLVIQSSRFSIDSMQQISDTMRCNEKLLPLIATKIGFFTDLKLTSDADRKILSAFPYIIKYKGSMEGILLVTNVFERIMNTKVSAQQDNDDKSHVTILFDTYTPNVELLYELLEYIRPTGTIIDYSVITDAGVSAAYILQDEVNITKIATANNDIAENDKESLQDVIKSNVGFAYVDNVESTEGEQTEGEQTI